MTDSEGAEPGRMESAVLGDLRGLGGLDTGVQASLAEAALILARAIDSYAKDAKTPAQLSAVTKAIQELRTTLGRLVELTNDNRRPAAGDSTPVWSDGTLVRDAAESGPADAGAADRGGGAPAG